MVEVHVSLVKYDDFARFDPGAQFPGALGVGVPRRVDDRKARQKTLQVQPQVALGRRFAPPVLGPIHTRGNQLDGRRVHQVNGPLESARKTLGGFATDKLRREIAQMFIHRPEQLFGHRRVAHLVGVREIVARGRGRASNRRQRPGVKLQRIADIVEPNAMGHLRVAEADDMAPLIKGASLLIDPSLPSQLGHQVVGNVVAKLTDNGEF